MYLSVSCPTLLLCTLLKNLWFISWWSSDITLLSLISLLMSSSTRSSTVRMHPAIFPLFWGNKLGMRHYQWSSRMILSLALSSCPKFIILKCMQQKLQSSVSGWSWRSVIKSALYVKILVLSLSQLNSIVLHGTSGGK